MRVLKTIGLIILIALAVMLIAPLFFASRVTVSESTHINALPANVFRQVNIIGNWSAWNPFEAEDPNMVSTYEGPELGAGATHIWKSVRMGDGQMTIVQSIPYTFIGIELDFYARGKAANEWYFEDKPDGTYVTWTIIFDDLGYPLGRILGIFMPGMMRQYLVNGLAKLKTIAEADTPATEIMEVEVEPFTAITIYDSVTYAEFSLQMGRNFAQLYNYSQIAAVDLAGPPFALYSKWDTSAYIHYMVGLPVYGEVRESSRIQYFVFPACDALMATHYGAYEGFDAIHNDIQLYMAEHSINDAGYPLEVYVAGPGTEEDTEKWVTEIYYPIE